VPNDDLIRQINKLVVASNILLERFARGYEELDGNHLALEEIRELLQEHFEENSRWADNLSKRIDRIEQFIILTRMGDKEQSGAITQHVTGEHLRRGLREQLSEQQELLQQYYKNIARIKLKIAKYGETTPLVNELEDNQCEIEKIEEAITRIREALK
jgi:hypothetical protein